MATEDDWTEDEIRVCVDQYIDVLKRGGAKKSISKDVFLMRAAKQLPRRNEGAVGRRMCNISHIAEMMGMKSVIGWKPLANVGPKNSERIKKMLSESGLV